MAHILIVDDEEKMRHILTIMLELKGHSVDQAGDGEEALSLIQKRRYDLLILDLKMPRMDGITLHRHVKKIDPSRPVLFITAFGSVDSAVEVMRQGALDYITKPFEEERILLTVDRAVKMSELLSENEGLRKEIAEKTGLSDLISVSKAMKRTLEMAQKVAQKPETTVLLTGESGTGKELVARYIHSNSPRAKGRFVAVNCAAISPNLVESELFGHEKGSFTSASSQKIGKFEFASGGTLFLDEVGDLQLESQAKVLRALEEKTFERVGGNKAITAEVRVICATNKDLASMVADKQFRDDLYYRINVFPIHIPPLRERKEAIVRLAEHFINRFAQEMHTRPQLTEGAKRLLYDHSWPGNVRELVNAMERAVILVGRDSLITEETLSFLTQVTAKPCSMTIPLPSDGLRLEEVERDLVRQALATANNNKTIAARLLGISRSKFRRKLKNLMGESEE